MIVHCENGFFKFYPLSVDELGIFKDKFGVDLVKSGDYYTFPALAILPDYSIKGAPYANTTAIKTYAGTPDEVFTENELNFTLEKGIITNKSIGTVGESPDNYNWVVTGIPSAYSRLRNKRLIKGYQGAVNPVAGYTIINRWDYADI